MKFKIVENDMDKLLTFRILSENNMVEIGVYRTLFGWRVRAGFANEGVCYLEVVIRFEYTDNANYVLMS